MVPMRGRDQTVVAGRVCVHAAHADNDRTHSTVGLSGRALASSPGHRSTPEGAACREVSGTSASDRGAQMHKLLLDARGIVSRLVHVRSRPDLNAPGLLSRRLSIGSFARRQIAFHLPTGGSPAIGDVITHPTQYSQTARLRKRISGAAILCTALFSAPAPAWDGAVSGKIAAIDVTGGSNFGFRIYLTGGQVMCTGGPTWAYLNDTDSNYKVYVAQLTLAKLASNQVTIYTTNAGGYCQIGYINVGS